MTRQAPAEMTPDEFRQAGRALVDRIADFLGELPNLPVTRATPTTAIRKHIDGDRPIPEQGTDVGSLLERTTDDLIRYSLFNAHPRFFGYITAGAAPIGVLGDLLASAMNPNIGSQTLAPIATEIERQTIRWIADLIGIDPNSGGVLVSGGNMANLTAFWAARTEKLGDAVRTGGIRTMAPVRVYVSADTHTWVQKAADLAGFGTEAVRWIQTDDDHRMDIRALRSQIDEDRAAGLIPMMVVGTAGTVGTGAIDPLHEIADLCAEYDLWFHADGAYGAFAAGLPDADPEFAALSLADSIAVDPHKWLYAPLDVGCVFVKDPALLRNAYSYHPDYFRFDPDTINYLDYGLENSRPFRALKVWLQVQQVGKSGYQAMIAEDCSLTRRLIATVEATDELEAHTCRLSIATFRYVPDDLRDAADQPDVREYLNTLNREIQDRVCASGEAFVSNAVLDGTYVLRACIVNFRTTGADVDALPELVRRVGREADIDLRPETGF